MNEKLIRAFVRDMILEHNSLLKEEESSMCPTMGKEIKKSWDAYEALIKQGTYKPTDKFILIDGAEQKLYVMQNFNSIRYMFCSTSASGFGNTNPNPESGPTSTGLMRVSGFLGVGEPVGTVFEKGKKVTRDGKTKIVLPADKSKTAYMTTRIIYLEGLQDENKNVRSRGIYIHGTNKEANLGKKASHGCIRVSNQNAVWLADNIPVGTLVYVFGNPVETNPPFPCEIATPSESPGSEEESWLDKVDKYIGDKVRGAGLKW